MAYQKNAIDAKVSSIMQSIVYSIEKKIKKRLHSKPINLKNLLKTNRNSFKLNRGDKEISIIIGITIAKDPHEHFKK